MKLTETELQNLRVVAAHMGVGISDYVRPLIFNDVEAKIEQRGLRPVLKRRSQSAPTKSVQ